MKVQMGRWYRKIGRGCCLGAVALMLYGCNGEQAAVAPAAPAVIVAPLESGYLQRHFRVSGVLRPVNRAQLAFQTSGVMTERLVDLGATVEAGQLLALVHNPRLKPEQAAALASVSETRARRDQARRDLARFRQLRTEGAVGEEQVEQKVAGLDALDAALERAVAQLDALRGVADEASLEAPFGGEITRVMVEAGEFVNAGQAVMSIGVPSALEVLVQVPAEYATLARDQMVTVEVPALRRQLLGRVDQISSQGAPQSGLFPVVVRLDNTDTVRAGQHAEVLIPWRSEQAYLLAPIAAVVDPIGGQPRVYRVMAGQVEQLSVELGPHLGGVIAITDASGRLNAGDPLVVNGHHALVDGQPVQVLP